MWRFVILLGLCSTALAEKPAFDTIDYASPAKYLAIPATLGNQDAITKQALALQTASDRGTVSNILRWMESHLQYDPDRAYEWRNYDTVVDQRCYGGCADQAIVCGVLLKSAGIPTVWVKTMDVPWIWDFKKQRQFSSWSGHVFLEVYLDHKWVLLDPGAATIYADYSPNSRILPGNRFAYHKGDDPKQMIMSLQWDAWKRQTESYFTELDESLLPVDPASAIELRPTCYIIANSPYYQVLAEIAHQKGIKTKLSFNNNYDKYLPLAEGQIILIETHAGVPIIDVDTLDRYFPSASDGIAAGKTVVADTTIVFVDFADLLTHITTEATEHLDSQLPSGRQLQSTSPAATR